MEENSGTFYFTHGRGVPDEGVYAEEGAAREKLTKVRSPKAYYSFTATTTLPTLVSHTGDNVVCYPSPVSLSPSLNINLSLSLSFSLLLLLLPLLLLGDLAAGIDERGGERASAHEHARVAIVLQPQ